MNLGVKSRRIQFLHEVNITNLLQRKAIAAIFHGLPLKGLNIHRYTQIRLHVPSTVTHSIGFHVTPDSYGIFFQRLRLKVSS